MAPTRRIPLACALIALIAAAVVLLPTLEQSGGRPSLLVRMSFAEPMSRHARLADHDFRFVNPDGHYDGVYFYGIAMDPLLLGEQHLDMTQPAYRYRGPLYGWLAGIASLGQTALIPWTLLLVNLTMLAVAAALVSVLAARLGASPWLGLLVALNPGFLVSLTVDTAEPTAMALIAAGMVAWLDGRRWLAAALLVGGAMSREIGALVAAGMILAELAAWWRLRAQRPALRTWVRRVSPLALAPVLYLAWWGLPVHPGRGVAHVRALQPGSAGRRHLDHHRGRGEAGRGGCDRQDPAGGGHGRGAGRGAGHHRPGIPARAAAADDRRRRRVAAAPLVLALNWLPMLYPKEMLRNTAVLGVLIILSFAAKPVARRASRILPGAASPPTRRPTWAGSERLTGPGATRAPARPAAASRRHRP